MRMLVQSTATYTRTVTHHSDNPPERLLQLALAEQRVDVLALGTAAVVPPIPIPSSLLSTGSPSASLLFQAYCLDPPIDSCDFGPCPNIDVTGIGQQISIYIMSVIFSIALLYRDSTPHLTRPLLYAHLGLVYSLLVATTLSMCFGTLTKNDEIFVLVIVASPASVALWVLTILQLGCGRGGCYGRGRGRERGRGRGRGLGQWFPVGKPKLNSILLSVGDLEKVKCHEVNCQSIPNPRRRQKELVDEEGHHTEARAKWAWEYKLLKFLSFASLVFELALVIVAIIPGPRLQSGSRDSISASASASASSFASSAARGFRGFFRQPACAELLKGLRAGDAFKWVKCYLENALWAVVGWAFWCGLWKLGMGRTRMIGFGKRELADEPDKPKWTGHENDSENAIEPEKNYQDRQSGMAWNDIEGLGDSELDIITWTERSLDRYLPSASFPCTKAAVILVLQCVALPDIGHSSYQNVGVIVVLMYAFIRDVIRSRRVSGFGISLVVLSGFPCVFGTSMHLSFPTSADMVLAYVCIVIMWFRLGVLSDRRHWRFIFRVSFIFGAIVALVGSAFAWVLYINSYSHHAIKRTQRTKKSFPNLLTLPIWFYAWFMDVVWPRRRTQRRIEMRSGGPEQEKGKVKVKTSTGRRCLRWWNPSRWGRRVVETLCQDARLSWAAVNARAHILKASLLIITPNVIWIQLSVEADISDSPNWTFGQLFAMLVSLVSIVSLIETAIDLGHKTWWAVLRSKRVRVRERYDGDLVDEGMLSSNEMEAQRPSFAAHRGLLVRP